MQVGEASEACPASLASIFGVRSARVVSAVAGRGEDELWEYCWACAQAGRAAPGATAAAPPGAARRGAARGAGAREARGCRWPSRSAGCTRCSSAKKANARSSLQVASGG
ncbi:unnamed protein product [Prorocentrum cordatum]|uniref:Uncharacterized protein n=1 Tax=Prorocentrum cordatum TaxID=2364126 RepID=A0ABN9SCJ0_9DINO|nr:unnamed protein product [Polarella glacialis]